MLPSRGSTGHVDMAVLGHEPDIVGGIPDQAALVGDLPASVDVERSGDGRGASVDAIAKLDVIDATIELKRTQPPSLNG